jgi:hypothetical protein
MSRKYVRVRLIGVANKKQQQQQGLWRSWAYSKHNETSFSKVSTDSLCLWVAQMPKSRDLTIFVVTDRQTKIKQTDRTTPCCACARGVILLLDFFCRDTFWSTWSWCKFARRSHADCVSSSHASLHGQALISPSRSVRVKSLSEHTVF